MLSVFDMCLLQDKNRYKVELITKDHKQEGTASYMQAIIRNWLTSGHIRTYQHLTECLKQSELVALAEDIAESCVQQ